METAWVEGLKCLHLALRDNYHNGLKLGRRLRNQPILKAFEAVTKPEIDTEQLKSIYNEFAPRCYQSLKGWRKDWKCLFPAARWRI